MINVQAPWALLRQVGAVGLGGTSFLGPSWEHMSWDLVEDPTDPWLWEGSARVVGCRAGSIPDSLTCEAMQRGRDFSDFVWAGP